MSYQALYRKYRSQRFDEMIGQEVVATTLKNAIVNEHISHAYLFSGPRGTGKTSAAKIFAKAINCLHPKDGEPDNTCYICEAINKGMLDDVIELDAASNNGVDEIREIRDKSTYAASQAAYKIYIIDEVHMLSTGAFNALLKTLEEPTENVVFILATTELQKIPATIISRVQRLAFKSITIDAIKNHLREILEMEAVKFDEKALAIIARAAEGGMRDALSLLDQALSFSDDHLKEKDALLVTGAIADEALVAYVKAIEGAKTPEALQQLDKIFLEGKNMLRFAEDLLAYFRDQLLDADSPLDHEAIYGWIDIVIDSLGSLKATSQTKVAADVMTMRLVESKRIPSQKQQVKEEPERTPLLSENPPPKEQISTSTPVVKEQEVSKQSKSVENAAVKNNVAPQRQTPVAQKEIFEILRIASKDALLSVREAWPEIISSLSSPREMALLKVAQIRAASKEGVVLTVTHENLAHIIHKNTALKDQIGNYLSNAIGLSPKILTITDEAWTKTRAAYVEDLQNSEDRSSQAPVIFEENEESEKPAKTMQDPLNAAQSLFGDKVIAIDD